MPNLVASYHGTEEERLEIFWTIGNLQEYHWYSVLLLHFCQDSEAIQRAKTAYNYYKDTSNDNRLIWTSANLIYAEWSNDLTKSAEHLGQKVFSFVSSDPQLKTLNLRNHSFVFLWLARLAFTRGDISQARQQCEYEEAVLRLQDILALETFTDAWEDGRAMTIDQAVQVAITAFNENKNGKLQ